MERAMDEAALEQRDDRVKAKLLERLAELQEEADAKRREAADAEKQAGRIRKAVLDGKWWEIQGLLGAADVGSLCEVEPTDRSFFLDPDRES